MRRLLFVSTLILMASACNLGANAPVPDEAEAAPTQPPPPVHERVIESQAYHLDKKYPSMTGPHGFDRTTLGEPGEPPELLWIVGYESRMRDPESGENVSQEFMCHANLDVKPKEYFDDFPTAPSLSGRLFTLSQGQYRIDFPQGFGIPISSDMELSLATQVLNLNYDDIDKKVRHEVTIRYLRDSEVHQPMTAMYQAAVEGFKALGDARYYGMLNTDVHDEDEFGPGCSVGQAAIAGDADNDTLGQQFTAHWVVPPGVEVNRTNVTRFLNLSFDTKAHYIAAHMHPFGETLVLRDLDTGEIVYQANVENKTDKIGIEKVDFYSSPEGIPLYKGHQYELISTYRNTSDADADSMAVLYLYLADPNFRKPKDLDRG